MRSYLLARVALLVGSLTTLASCHKTASSARAVYLGPTAVYQLSDNAKELLPDKFSTTFYQDRFNFHPQYNQPLHRIVAVGNSTDKVYLGVVLPPLPADLSVLTESDSIWQLIERRALPNHSILARLRSKKGAEFDVRYLGASAKSQNTHVVNYLTADSATAQRIYLADKPFEGKLLL
jgi:hypothetical protein